MFRGNEFRTEMPWHEESELVKHEEIYGAYHKSLDGSVGIATGFRLDDRRSEVGSWQSQEFSLCHVVQTGSGAHPTSYSMGTAGSFPGGRVAGS
jgi:hypothetical protein